MPIDSFGSCLHNTNDRTIPRTPRNELIRVVSQYKFYLAIENSNCEDYITEKLNTAIESGAVPVVFAPNNVPDYRKILPMGSFINLADFSSAKKAASYLLRVASDDELYVVFSTYLHSNNNNNVKNRYNSFRWFEKLDTKDRLKLKQSLLKRWPTTGTSEESVCQLVRKLKSWHGDNDAIMNYEDAIRIPEFRDVEWLNKNGRSRISNAQGFLDDTCLPKHSMLNYL